MALTPEQIDAEAFARWGDMKGAPLAMCRGFARAIEAEVHKEYEALIRQMLVAMDNAQTESRWGNAYGSCDTSTFDAPMAAARARLGTNPPPGPDVPKPEA